MGFVLLKDCLIALRKDISKKVDEGVVKVIVMGVLPLCEVCRIALWG